MADSNKPKVERGGTQRVERAQVEGATSASDPKAAFLGFIVDALKVKAPRRIEALTNAVKNLKLPMTRKRDNENGNQLRGAAMIEVEGTNPITSDEYRSVAGKWRLRGPKSREHGGLGIVQEIVHVFATALDMAATKLEERLRSPNDYELKRRPVLVDMTPRAMALASKHSSRAGNLWDTVDTTDVVRDGTE